MTTIRRYPSSRSYSESYRSDLEAAWREIRALLREGEFPLPRLVWRARALYREAWVQAIARGDHVGE